MVGVEDEVVYGELILYLSNLLFPLGRHGYPMHARGPYDIVLRGIDLCIRMHGPANHKDPFSLLPSPLDQDSGFRTPQQCRDEDASHP